MISSEEFNRLRECAGQFAHTSLMEECYEEARREELICEKPGLLLLLGQDPETGTPKLNWAADQAEDLLSAVTELIAAPSDVPSDLLLPFVPEEWKHLFLEKGFTEYGIMRDYWINDLPAILSKNTLTAPAGKRPENGAEVTRSAVLPAAGDPYSAWTELAPEEADSISEVTKSVRFQSREFTGESPEWIRSWISGTEPNAAEAGCRDTAVLGKYLEGTLAGVAVTGLYGDASSSGPILWIRELAVRPEYQNRGIGRSLLTSAFYYGVTHGAKRAFLAADDLNRPGLHLYRSLGFEPNLSECQIDLIYRRPALEPMGEFFNRRSDIYDSRQVRNIGEGAACYQEAAKWLPGGISNLVDLGCGTGLELAAIFQRFPKLAVTGIDLAEGMLARLREKYPLQNITLHQMSYFDFDFGEARYDAALSVETLHHFTQEEKIGLYRKLCRGLKPGAVYVECDYMAPDQAYEDFYFAENRRIRAELGITDGFYHFDTPCTVENQIRMLKEAGFSRIEPVWEADGTVILKAVK